ncbi:MAG: AAA family ATPase, partial [Myxococcota bacterium]
MWGLLAKSPLQRPGYAHVLLRALEDAGIATELRQSSLEGRAYLHRPVFLGRASMVEQLVETLTQVSQAAQGQRMLLSGESGVGKSTLVQELSREARRMGVRVVVGYSSHTLLRAGQQEERPLGLFVPILRAVADRWNQEHTLQAGLLSPTDVALLAPFAPFIAQLPGLEEAATVRLSVLPVEMAQLRLWVCLMGVLERFCGGQPTLFVFEDLHWADELSLTALEFMCREFVEGLPWMVVGTYRSEERTDDLQMFIDESSCQVVEVERLGNLAVTELVGHMLGDDLDGALTQALATRAGGNPFFAAEYLRAMVDSGALQLDSNGRWATAASDPETLWSEPESIQALLARRLGKLRRDEQRLCEVAAVVGRRMHADLLCQLSGMTPFAFNNALDELIQLQILESDPETLDARELQFVHDRLRETAYTQTPPDRLAHIHNTTAQTLEGLGDGVDWATVALHWAKGGDPKRARQGYIEAARQDAERWAVRNARRHIEAALALEPVEAASKEMALRMELIRLSQLLGEHAEAIVYAEQALELLGTDQTDSSHTTKAIPLHLDIASSLGHQTRFTEAQAHLDQAENLIEGLEHKGHLEGRLVLVKGTLSAEFEDHAATTAALFERAAQLLAQSGDTKLQAQSLVGLSGALLALTRPDEAMERCREAQRLYQQNHDLHGEALLWERVGQIRAHQAPEEALGLVRNALDAHQTAGNGVGEARTLSLMGHVLGQLGRYAEGLQCLMRANRLQERYGISRWKVMASIAIIHVYLGQMQQGADWII